MKKTLSVWALQCFLWNCLPLFAQLEPYQWNAAGSFFLGNEGSSQARPRAEMLAQAGWKAHKNLMTGLRYYFTTSSFIDRNGDVFGPYWTSTPGFFGRAYLGRKELLTNLPLYPYLDIFLGSFLWNGENRGGASTTYAAIQNQTAVGLAWWPVKTISVEGEVRFASRPHNEAAEIANDRTYNGSIGAYWSVNVWLLRKNKS